MARTEKPPSPLGVVVALIVGCILFLAVAEIGVRLVYPDWRDFYSGRFIETEFKPGRAGVAIGRPGFNGYFAQNNGDFRVAIKINDGGLRNSEPMAAADGRIWIVGDSMAFGWGVEQPEMYSSVIARLSGKPTYNIASPGTDVCGYQALISRMPAAAKPTAVIVGLILENDIREYHCRDEYSSPAAPAAPVADNRNRLLNAKRWLTEYSGLYNAVAVSLKRVAPIVGALESLGMVNVEHAYKLTFDRTRVNALALSVAEELANTRGMVPAGVPFAVLIAPSRFEIRDNDPLYHHLREAIATAIEARGMDVIDPIAGFMQAGFKPTHFAHDGHWSPLGHKIAGEAAVKWVTKALPAQ